MDISNREKIFNTLKLLVNKETTDKENCITLNELCRLTLKLHKELYDETKALVNRMENKYGSRANISINYDENKDEMHFSLYNGVSSEILISCVDNDLIITDSDNFNISDNLMQQIGVELQSYYLDILKNDAYIKNYNINTDNYSIVFRTGDTDVYKMYFRFEIGNTLECNIEKKQNFNLKINCDSYDITNFIDENIDTLLNNVYIPKELIPKLIIEEYEKEITEKKIKEENELQKNDVNINNCDDTAKENKSLIKSILKKFKNN